MPNRVRGKGMFLFVHNLLLWSWRRRHALLEYDDGSRKEA